MAINKNVLTALKVLALVLVAATVAYAGWLWYQDATEEETSTTAQQQADISETEESGIDLGEVVELDSAIELASLEDVENLPDATPRSFIEHVSDMLEENRADGNDCMVRYSVSKISNVNVAGTGGSVDIGSGEATDNCPGMSDMVWYQAQAGMWSEMGIEAPPQCDLLEEGGIYSEFIEECYELESGELIENPNGSITQLAG